ncbi:MAG: betaine/proline/choline family ABC transporter ATP-binding protein [Acidimicrobiaceae bacterium]|jgi:glycine betaine/proline transport system ATP-binding protein|nr:betaine/proline/choline family ABC transporter ATP-binding protein [Acidimicrobiaceae bacterium]MBT5578961.1 betaine/proline/choline family ABC transporter ATP-binding protein [Acidimicrobiaceae bacterium]MBT5851553.1 betaine/proline/choline family ABC transporter ATP-binding protein [Acidimicrobiaceae bacterium]
MYSPCGRSTRYERIFAVGPRGNVSESKLSCRNVWKLFGPDPRGFLRSHDGHPSPEQVKKSGYISAVYDASLEVYEGEILVLMGLSGSGKSTLVRCLSRLIEPTAGEMLFDGSDLLAATDKEMIEIRRHKMGMVFQHFALFPHRTVLDNVAFPLEIQGVEREERRAKGREILELVGLSGRDNYYPRELSGGQQQRVGIGRSLAVEPDVWFLDEPFSALDPLIRKEMQDEFLRLQDQLHKTIVFITHDFDEAIRLADRVAIMYEGRIDQIGTPEEIITNPATDYVRKFTSDVSREKLLSVGSVMRPATAGTTGSGSVPSDAKLGDVASQVLGVDGDHHVHDDSGSIVGVVDRSDLISALYGEQT